MRAEIDPADDSAQTKMSRRGGRGSVGGDWVASSICDKGRESRSAKSKRALNWRRREETPTKEKRLMR